MIDSPMGDLKEVDPKDVRQGQRLIILRAVEGMIFLFYSGEGWDEISGDHYFLVGDKPEMPDVATVEQSQVETIGSLIWNTSRHDENSISAMGADIIANAILSKFHVTKRGSQAIQDIINERARQDAKWGEQNHPDGTGRLSVPLNRIVHNGPISPVSGSRHYALGLSLMAKEATDKAAKEGVVSWADILLEEVFEALAESDPEKLRTELIQTAAVATQWAEAIDRRQRIAEGEAIQKAEEADNA